MARPDQPTRPAASGFLGHAGEHYVLYQLYRRGLLAALSPRGAPTVDVLVMAPDESVIASVQVKTRAAKDGWHMRAEHERTAAPHLFYAFVDLTGESPVTYVVPSEVVADALAAYHRVAVEAGRKDTDMRWLANTYKPQVPAFSDGWLDAHRERWDLLTAKSA